MTQVAGPYVPQFEIYWKKLDPENTGKVDNFFVTSGQNIGDCLPTIHVTTYSIKVAPMVAAQFLKLSGLSDQTLGKVRKLNHFYYDYDKTIMMADQCADRIPTDEY